MISCLIEFIYNIKIVWFSGGHLVHIEFFNELPLKIKVEPPELIPERPKIIIPEMNGPKYPLTKTEFFVVFVIVPVVFIIGLSFIG